MNPTRQQWEWVVIIGAIWVPVLARLTDVWNNDPEMGHGWLVPILSAYLAWESSDRFRGGSPGNAGATVMAVLGLLGSAAGLWVLVANPLWPSLMWFTVAAASTATLGIIATSQGWAAARRGLALVALMFLALPWPTMIQQPITLGLAQMNAHVAAEIVSAQGYPAAVQGRVIEVGAGVVGVEEACSGIRSLQSVTMAAIFLAALFHLSWKQGLGLLLAGWVVAVSGNLIRTCFLVHVLAQEGVERMDAVHDAAGNWVLLATLGIMAATAWWLPSNPVSVESPRALPSSSKVGGLRRWVVVTASLAVLTQAGVTWWYAGEAVEQNRVGIAWAESAGGRPEQIPRHAQEMLSYSDGGGRSWTGRPAEPSELAFLFHWDGDVKFLGSAAMHDPTICLPGIGSRLERQLDDVVASWSNADIRFQCYRFRTARGRTQFVFFQVWDAFRGMEWDAQTGYQRSQRWQRVRDRQLTADVYQLMMVVESEWSDAEARAYASTRLPQLFAPVLAESRTQG